MHGADRQSRKKLDIHMSLWNNPLGWKNDFSYRESSFASTSSVPQQEDRQ
jgi:hypothetical protein